MPGDAAKPTAFSGILRLWIAFIESLPATCSKNYEAIIHAAALLRADGVGDIHHDV
jgi:hypothetical protein